MVQKKDRNRCWEKVTKKWEEIRTQTIVGKLPLNMGSTPIPVRMRNDNLRCDKFNCMYIKVIYISELSFKKWAG